MRNIAMRLKFDGSGYHGWQYQTNGVTLQETIERALGEICGEKIRVTGCSRTDAGVHALDYVMNFKTNCKIPTSRFPYALNGRLGDDITVTEAREVPTEFNARFSAKGKRYIYLILNDRFPSPFLSRYSWFLPYKLNLEDMKEAAECFVGTHDFKGFMACGGQQKTTVRTVFECSVKADPKNLIKITVAADAFLYNMVRIITGTLVYVGCGKIKKDEIPEIIRKGDRRECGVTAPPQGLFLEKVYLREDDKEESHEI